MQGLYFRPNAKSPWVLMVRTRSVAHAEQRALWIAKLKTCGRIVYLEAQALPSDVWDLRQLKHRKLGGWLVKSLRTGWKRVQKSGRKVWVRIDSRQTSLLGLTIP